MIFSEAKIAEIRLDKYGEQVSIPHINDGRMMG
jgi:hypothetical protein